MGGAGFLAIWSDVAAADETDYLHWLTREHTEERLSVPGFLSVRVFRALRRDVSRYFILYELDSAEVLASDGYLARLNAPTPWSQRIMPKLGNFARGGGRVTAESGKGKGGVLAAIRFDDAAETVDLAALDKLASRDRIVAARLLETDLTRTAIATREKGMRAHDGTFSSLLLIEGVDEDAVATAARQYPTPDQLLYAHVFKFSADGHQGT